MAKKIHTMHGSVAIDSLGLILPHEHLSTDLRGPHVPDYARAEPSHVAEVVKPFLDDAFDGGYTALARDFIPALLKQRITDAQVRLITVTNPANAFAF